MGQPSCTSLFRNQRQEAKVKPTISDHKEGDGGRSQEGEEGRFYHQKKKKGGKTRGEKKHRHAPTPNRVCLRSSP